LGDGRIGAASLSMSIADASPSSLVLDAAERCADDQHRPLSQRVKLEITSGFGYRLLSGSAGAEQAYRDALATRRTLFPPDHADVGVSLENLGIVLQKQGRNTEAVAMLDSALNILLPAFSAEHRLIRVAVAYRDSALN
jgi:tetratricopeptide (TPR) repeat protein